MTTKKTPRIKNYTTQLSDAQIFEAIGKTLSSHKARRVTFDYDDAGRAVAIEFIVEVGKESCAFRLPARFQKAEPLVAQARKAARLAASGPALSDALYRVVWAVIRDWLDAQMALIDIGPSSIEEVFLPYLVEGNKTLFERFAEQRALPMPARRVVISEE